MHLCRLLWSVLNIPNKLHPATASINEILIQAFVLLFITYWDFLDDTQIRTIMFVWVFKHLLGAKSISPILGLVNRALIVIYFDLLSLLSPFVYLCSKALAYLAKVRENEKHEHCEGKLWSRLLDYGHDQRNLASHCQHCIRTILERPAPRVVESMCPLKRNDKIDLFHHIRPTRDESWEHKIMRRSNHLIQVCIEVTSVRSSEWRELHAESIGFESGQLWIKFGGLDCRALAFIDALPQVYKDIAGKRMCNEDEYDGCALYAMSARLLYIHR